MEVRRTVLVALDVGSDVAALLEDTVDTPRWSAQYVVDHAFQGEYVTTSNTTTTSGSFSANRVRTAVFK